MARWLFDPDHTVAHFTTRHMMITIVHGQFNRFSGEILFDPADIQATSLQVEIDASGLWTGVEARDRHLRSPDFFDVEKFPVIRFKSTGAEVVASNFMKVHGELTVRDVTRPILLHAAWFGPLQYQDETGSYTTMGFSATAAVNREDFGMKWNNDFGRERFMVGKHIELALDAEADLSPEP
jgi:polyisoprenoid-binding protein YceI